MEGKIRITAVAKQYNNGWLFVPATRTDRDVMNQFCYENGDNYVTLVVNTRSKADKTYQQLKALFALVVIAWELDHNGSRPTEIEKGLQYNSFIQEYADRQPSLVNPSESVPITASMMSEGQMSRFIQSICNNVMEKMGQAPDSFIVVECKEVFEEFTSYKNNLDQDPTDVDEEGNYLTVEEWEKRHPASMADGTTEAIETAHIMGKGTRPEFRYCVWNLMRLTHEQHIEIQHGKEGWEGLFSRFPFLRGRYDRAMKLIADYDAGRITMKELVNDKYMDGKNTLDNNLQVQEHCKSLKLEGDASSLASEALEIF